MNPHASLSAALMDSSPARIAFRRDRSLNDIGIAALQRGGTVERLTPARDLGGVSARAVLVDQQHQLPVFEAGTAGR